MNDRTLLERRRGRRGISSHTRTDPSPARLSR